MSAARQNTPRGKLGLRGSEGVTEMKHTVHVGIGEGSHETGRQRGKYGITEDRSCCPERRFRKASPVPTAPASSSPFRGDGLFSRKTTRQTTTTAPTLAPI